MQGMRKSGKTKIRAISMLLSLLMIATLFSGMNLVKAKAADDVVVFNGFTIPKPGDPVNANFSFTTDSDLFAGQSTWYLQGIAIRDAYVERVEGPEKSILHLVHFDGEGNIDQEIDTYKDGPYSDGADYTLEIVWVAFEPDLISGTKISVDGMETTINRVASAQVVMRLPFTVGEKPKSVESIEVTSDADYVEIGKTMQMSATVLPENASYLTMEWGAYSNDVNVDKATGLIEGVTEGTVMIVVNTTDEKGNVVQGRKEIQVVPAGYKPGKETTDKEDKDTDKTASDKNNDTTAKTDKNTDKAQENKETVTTKPDTTADTNAVKDVVPKTGENSVSPVWFVLAAVGGLGILYFGVKRVKRAK